MTSLTSKREIRSDSEFKKILEEVDNKFWSTIEYEKNLYSINRSNNIEDGTWPSEEIL